MTDVHQILGWVVVVPATAGLLLAAAWSTVAARQSGGAVDHKFAVDRLVLVAGGAIAVNGVLGLAIAAGGARPADPLHLLYGPAAVATLAVGAWWARRGPAGGDEGGRAAVDLRLAVVALILLGLEYRLLVTG